MDLTDAELAELDDLLAQTPPPLEPLDMVTLDGYLCAVLVQPRLIPQEEWLLPVFDTEGRARADGIEPAPGWRDRIATLARRRHAALNEAMADTGWFDPLIPPPDEELAEDLVPDDAAPAALAVAAPGALSPARIRDTIAPWAAGFEYGLNCFPHLLDGDDDGDGRLDDPAVGQAIARVLRHLEPQEDAERELQAVLDREHPLTTLDDAVDDLVVAVADLWELTRESRYKVEARRREAPKVGRNDPCPCGSGRKFKRCHGADAG
jgi:uncharacterized protein